MYKIKRNDGREIPLEIELNEEFEGEVLKEVLEHFIENGMYSDIIHIKDSVSEEDIKICVKDYLNEEEIEKLKELEKELTEEEWDSLTMNLLYKHITGKTK